MPKYDIQIQIDDDYCDSVAEKWLLSLVTMVLESEQVASPAEVSLVITGQDTIRKLNGEYRGIDEPTDVLSFALRENRGRRSSFPAPPDGVERLGEVVVSYPQAAAQAAERGGTPEQETALLVIHGVLHLLGYDHMKAAEEKVMQEKQAALLDGMFQL